MQHKHALQQLCYSSRLIHPFLRVLEPGATQAADGCGRGRSSPTAVGSSGHRDPREVRDTEARLPVGLVHEWLAAAIANTHDPELGLKAGASMRLGDAGVLDYVVSSAPTVAAAIDATIRYMRLANEAIECRLEVERQRAVLWMETRVVLPPAAEDFMLAGYFSAQPWMRSIPGLECWFMHAAPQRHAEYDRVFGPTVRRFAAPCSAWSFAPAHLERPLPQADRNLYGIVRRLADGMLAELPSDTSLFGERVRALVARELTTPGLNAAWTARRLRMSVRTLARRLEAEGTSFYALLEDVRRARALQLIADERLALSEIAFMLGFAHATSFHRAFRRWTGRTPADYRMRQATESLSA